MLKTTIGNQALLTIAALSVALTCATGSSASAAGRGSGGGAGKTHAVASFGRVSLNPQPLPPGVRAALNPQPLPPGFK